MNASMIAEAAFEGLLGLDECWEVSAAEYEQEPAERFLLVIKETQKLWNGLSCPVASCGCDRVVCHDHCQPRIWRHLDAFGKRTEILCTIPRARCSACRKVWQIGVPWGGEGKHFTKDFEAFALTLMREMPMTKAGNILGEQDTRMWRMLFSHVDKAYAQLDLSDLTHIGVDEMNMRKGHHYLSVFADLIERRVIFATEGKDHKVFERFVEEMAKHNGHPKSVMKAAIDLSKAYQKGVKQELPRAKIVFDPFHVSALAGKAVDEVRRKEVREGDDQTKASLKKSLYLFRKNPENLTSKEQERMDKMDLRYLATGQAYTIRLELRDIYQRTHKGSRARYRLENWVNWARCKCEKFGSLLDPIAKLVKTIERHMEGILAHWDGGLTTAFMEGLNSVFSAVKRDMPWEKWTGDSLEQRIKT